MANEPTNLDLDELGKIEHELKVLRESQQEQRLLYEEKIDNLKRQLIKEISKEIEREWESKIQLLELEWKIKHLKMRKWEKDRLDERHQEVKRLPRIEQSQRDFLSDFLKRELDELRKEKAFKIWEQKQIEERYREINKGKLVVKKISEDASEQPVDLQQQEQLENHDGEISKDAEQPVDLQQHDQRKVDELGNLQNEAGLETSAKGEKENMMSAPDNSSLSQQTENKDDEPIEELRQAKIRLGIHTKNQALKLGTTQSGTFIYVLNNVRNEMLNVSKVILEIDEVLKKPREINDDTKTSLENLCKETIEKLQILRDVSLEIQTFNGKENKHSGIIERCKAISEDIELAINSTNQFQESLETTILEQVVKAIGTLAEIVLSIPVLDKSKNLIREDN